MWHVLFAKKLNKIRQIWPWRSLKHFTAAYRGFPPCTQSQPPANRETGYSNVLGGAGRASLVETLFDQFHLDKQCVIFCSFVFWNFNFYFVFYILYFAFYILCVCNFVFCILRLYMWARFLCACRCIYKQTSQEILCKTLPFNFSSYHTVFFLINLCNS